MGPLFFYLYNREDSLILPEVNFHLLEIMPLAYFKQGLGGLTVKEPHLKKKKKLLSCK